MTLQSRLSTARTFLLILLVLVSAALPAQAGESKPNILLVLMDNFGYGEPGVYGGGVLRGAATPNIDGIAREGYRLTNYNVEAECTPSRAALMTGRYAVRTRLQKDGTLRDIWYGLTRWEVTMGEVLSGAGYATGIFGKWHLGDEAGRFPTDQGFDEWYGIPNSSDVAYWPDSSTFQPGSHAFAVPAHVLSSTRGQKPKQLEVYGREKRRLIDREVTDRAIDFMRRSAKSGKPFFAYVPFTQTHDPTEPHPDFAGRTGNGDFADVLAQSDAYVGELLRTVDALGLRENTIVVFTSDNGNDFAEGSLGFSGPWRGSMYTPFEGSLRVPFIIRWPGRVPEGRESNEMVHEIDVLPTLASLVSAPLPKDRTLDGLDQSVLLSGKSDKSPRESIVIYVNNALFGAKWRNWKILYQEIGRDGQSIRAQNFPSIYNLIIDPKEEDPFRTATLNTWVEGPLSQVVTDHKASLEADPGSPES